MLTLSCLYTHVPQRQVWVYLTDIFLKNIRFVVRSLWVMCIYLSELFERAKYFRKPPANLPHTFCKTIFHSLVISKLVSTLPMLRLLSKTQGCNDFCEPSKPCHVGIHWITMAEYSQMSTHVPRFCHFSGFSALFCIGEISHQQHKG